MNSPYCDDVTVLLSLSSGPPAVDVEIDARRLLLLGTKEEAYELAACSFPVLADEAK